MTTVSLSNIFLALYGGFDMSSFETSTGTTWGEFSTGQPEAAAFIIHLERLIGVGSLGFALFGAALAWTSYRQGERYVFYYGAAGVIALLGLFLPYRKFFPKA